MNITYLLLIILLFIITYNKIYFSITNKIIFINYIKYFFLYFTITSYMFFNICNIFLIKLDFFLIKNVNNFLEIFLLSYVLVFISMLLTIGLKYINSPTDEMIRILKIKKNTSIDLIKKMEKKKIVQNRIRDLIKQKLVMKNTKLVLSKSGVEVASFFNLIRKLFKIKVEG